MVLGAGLAAERGKAYKEYRESSTILYQQVPASCRNRLQLSYIHIGYNMSSRIVRAASIEVSINSSEEISLNGPALLGMVARWVWQLLMTVDSGTESKLSSKDMPTYRLAISFIGIVRSLRVDLSR
jgi:hypothetical protein